jgi:hypothetical protein
LRTSLGPSEWATRMRSRWSRPRCCAAFTNRRWTPTRPDPWGPGTDRTEGSRGSPVRTSRAHLRPAGWPGSRYRRRAPAWRTVRVARLAREELADVLPATVDVAANVVGIVALEISGPHRVPGQDRRPESRREALDLALYGLGHVPRGAVGHVAVGPGRVVAAGARAGSNRDGCARMTNGRSGRRLLATSRLPASISSRVPPRWIVAARAHPVVRHGMGALSAQSSLKTPTPGR